MFAGVAQAMREMREEMETPYGPAVIYSLERLGARAGVNLARLPYSLRVLLENLLRHTAAGRVSEEQVEALAGWRPGAAQAREIPFYPARVVLQDFTGVPAVVDLAALRAAVRRMGGEPRRVNPLCRADLVIDHSVQVDFFASDDAVNGNVRLEYERNVERYKLLRWAQRAFANLAVVPPGTGIVHQVNLEYLACVVCRDERDEPGGRALVYPDTLLGTDSHTTMINGLGVLGWGVGGIEAEAVLLGQPYAMLIPDVVGVRLRGELPPGTTATDLVLTVTERLRRHGVVGRFVEFGGPGAERLQLGDRATLANMAPEYGATMGFFPVDGRTLGYLRATGRDERLIALVERYCKHQGLYRAEGAPEPEYSEVVEIDLGGVEPSLAGPRRPQDRLALSAVRDSFRRLIATGAAPARTDGGRQETSPEGTSLGGTPLGGTPVGRSAGPATVDGGTAAGGATVDQVRQGAVTVRDAAGVADGAVVIAAITSCTNTSNPSVMVAAGLLARKAVERGLAPKPWVKTSLAPGSRVVTDYLRALELLPYLERLGFYVVGYGCTTCIGNSGNLPAAVAEAVVERDLTVAAVLSGNRNFEGRINPLVKANYLASPPLVVAYALAGSVDVDLGSEPLGIGSDGRPVYLRDIWPGQAEVRAAVEAALDPAVFRAEYARVAQGDERWRRLPTPEGELYAWEPDSTYVREPPYFLGLPAQPTELQDIRGARVLALLGDSITTDHISPAGAIPVDSPAGRYLEEHGVVPADFNSYGARRGNHEVMVRGTLGNIRLRNRLAPGRVGGWTTHLPSGDVLSIYEAAVRYGAAGTPLLVVAGKEYGSGSSRDWAAKGTRLLGVGAVLAESFERIHRSNLIGMGVLPLEFKAGENAESLGLDGSEAFDVEGIQELRPGGEVLVRARHIGGAGGVGSARAGVGARQAAVSGGGEVRFTAVARVDTPLELEYYRHGGILPFVLRRLWHAD